MQNEIKISSDNQERKMLKEMENFKISADDKERKMVEEMKEMENQMKTMVEEMNNMKKPKFTQRMAKRIIYPRRHHFHIGGTNEK